MEITRERYNDAWTSAGSGHNISPPLILSDRKLPWLITQCIYQVSCKDSAQPPCPRETIKRFELQWTAASPVQWDTTCIFHVRQGTQATMRLLHYFRTPTTQVGKLARITLSCMQTGGRNIATNPRGREHAATQVKTDRS